jgi:Transmembrane protein 65
MMSRCHSWVKRWVPRVRHQVPTNLSEVSFLIWMKAFEILMRRSATIAPGRRVKRHVTAQILHNTRPFHWKLMQVPYRFQFSYGDRNSHRMIQLLKKVSSCIVRRYSGGFRVFSSTTLVEPPITAASALHATTNGDTTVTLPPPTSLQLRRVFYMAALPMIGFGIMDQTVMLQAGHAIDCTLGVTFGLPTLTAAAFGQVCSDASGVMFGNTLEQFASRIGLPSSGLSAAQCALPIVQRTKFVASLAGVILGCTLGLFNLLIIDTERSSTLKLQALHEEQEFEFLVEASNAERKDVTVLTVTGPDVDGILASMTAALALRGCSLVELHAKGKPSSASGTPESDDSPGNGTIIATADDLVPETPLGVKDVFYVVDRRTGQPFEDDELHDLAESLLEATRTPMNAIGVKAVINELEKSNQALRQRVRRLEEVVKEKQIRVVPTPIHAKDYVVSEK